MSYDKKLSIIELLNDRIKNEWDIWEGNEFTTRNKWGKEWGRETLLCIKCEKKKIKIILITYEGGRVRGRKLSKK